MGTGQTVIGGPKQGKSRRCRSSESPRPRKRRRLCLPASHSPRRRPTRPPPTPGPQVSAGDRSGTRSRPKVEHTAVGSDEDIIGGLFAPTRLWSLARCRGRERHVRSVATATPAATIMTVTQSKARPRHG